MAKEIRRNADLPQHIMQLKSQWKEQQAERERQIIYRLDPVNVKVLLNVVYDSEALHSELYFVHLPRTNFLVDVYDQALKFFEEKARRLAKDTDAPVVYRHHRLLIRHTNEGGLTIYEAYASKADLAKVFKSSNLCHRICLQ
ncbi:unnamed protein product [Heligmosomoides polygyrus]|uniref:Uncharacterized protein n=1 Tax=Heligmosomoides polygyrus TaxID=6339 RepID=A0A3P7TTG0_HELPZ|nr:unnamed protein product [Heligmosomoides polygyrus]